MKKLISAVSAFIAVSFMASNIYAAPSIQINKAEKTDTGTISVECTVNEPDVYQGITVISCEQNNADFSKSCIYIDQFTEEMSKDNNTFSFVFSPASWADFVSKDKVYIVKVGGTNIAEPDSMIIVSHGGEVVYAKGDINNDGTVNEVDAILLLKYVSGIENLTETQIEAGHVNDDDKVDIRDVTEILKKTINSLS